MKNLYDKPERPTEAVLANTFEELIKIAKIKISRSENSSDLFSVEDFMDLGLISPEVFEEFRTKFYPRLKGEFDPKEEDHSKVIPVVTFTTLLRMIYLSTFDEIESIKEYIKEFNKLRNPKDFYHKLISQLGNSIVRINESKRYFKDNSSQKAYSGMEN